ncbi:MAG: alpha/beta hydrolase [Acetobacter indonesiensis]|nr:alpha/beta hydrolase [Acetobacter indonesiensis]MCI1766443.1 alpha/beta hydrolase [Acetobacter indonesiensis]
MSVFTVISTLFQRVRGYGEGRQKLCAACGVSLLSMASACSSTMPPAPTPPARFAAAARLVPANMGLPVSDGAVIPARRWPATAPEHAILLAYHGFNDSRDAWESTAPFFTQHGVTVIAPDQRGFGQAPMRGGWAGVPRMLADMRDEIAQIRAAHPNTPLYLAGESMGGALLMLLMAQPDAPHVAGTILLAPAVWNVGVGADVPLRVVATLFPKNLVTGRELPVHVVASDNMAALIRLYYDPLTLRATRLEALRGLVGLMKQAGQAAASLHGKVLCVYGDQDQLVPPEAMAHIWQTMPSTVRRDLIPGGHHLLLRDRNGQMVMKDMVGWMINPETWLPSGGDFAASAWAALGQGQTHWGKNSVPLFLPAQLDGVVSP